ncbi:MAG: META domain-containing protein [Dysgonamonadaceae bacterium]
MKTKKNYFLLSLVVLLFAACSTSKKTEVVPKKITGMDWKLVSVRANSASPVISPVESVVATLRFADDEKSVSGTTGCNRFNGPITKNGNQITFGSIAATRMFCEQSMDLENAFMQAFKNANSISLQGDMLYIESGSDVLMTFTSK